MVLNNFFHLTELEIDNKELNEDEEESKEVHINNAIQEEVEPPKPLHEVQTAPARREYVLAIAISINCS